MKKFALLALGCTLITVTGCGRRLPSSISAPQAASASSEQSESETIEAEADAVSATSYYVPSQSLPPAPNYMAPQQQAYQQPQQQMMNQQQAYQPQQQMMNPQQAYAQQAYAQPRMVPTPPPSVQLRPDLYGNAYYSQSQLAQNMQRAPQPGVYPQQPVYAQQAYPQTYPQTYPNPNAYAQVPYQNNQRRF